MLYADVIIDISTQALDHTFSYGVPEELASEVEVGCMVDVPFGRSDTHRSGYVISVSTETDYDPEKIKNIISVKKPATGSEAQLLKLASWMREHYGSTLYDALKTVFPSKVRAREQKKTWYHLNIDKNEARSLLEDFRTRKYTARARFMQALLDSENCEKGLITGELHVGKPVIDFFQKEGYIKSSSSRVYRNPYGVPDRAEREKKLNSGQQKAYDAVSSDFDRGIRRTYLLYGVTGSGKTEVYIDLIAHVVSMGYQAIMLIPEISLTYQTIQRFSARFGDRVTVIHSKLTAAQRFDQFDRARKGEVDVVIGPRSALFSPLPNPGLIVVDEEHETSYKSEQPPRYHARDVAVKKAELSGASVILGSATPSVVSYRKALNGEYRMLTLTDRAVPGAVLPKVSVVDMRQELMSGNHTPFSKKLLSSLNDRLEKGQQSILFINRRGYSNFVSCRQCGYVVKCPHCDVSLTYHRGGRMVCHYCGYETRVPEICPQCGSRYIRRFGVGTEQIEEKLKEIFPKASILRLDGDTTKNRDRCDEILSSFANHESDILIGTQMVVKGHDFADVTLVCALAADMSLFDSDYTSAEKTFDLLAQAAGRAGRGDKPGEMIIQTYRPDQYAIKAAAAQDYPLFYRKESAYRKLLSYPPESHMLAVFMTCENEQDLDLVARLTKNGIKAGKMDFYGPNEASIYRLADTYRKVIYVKDRDYEKLVELKDRISRWIQSREYRYRTVITFDFDPVKMY